MEPIYTEDNTTPAFQLNWSVSLFGKGALPPPSVWLDPLKSATELDGIRILEAHLERANVGQFLVSTRPAVAPSMLVWSLKGRWKHLIESQYADGFRRNYSVASVGDVNCRVLDQYVAGQPDKHVMVDRRVQARLQSIQFHDPAVDLHLARTSNHGRFLHSLQVVVENIEGLPDIREEVLLDSREMIVRTAARKRWLVSRIGILSNHIHILLGAYVTESPASVAMSLMNNLAYVQGMKPVLRFSYYVGTFGPYDLGAVRRQL